MVELKNEYIKLLEFFGITTKMLNININIIVKNNSLLIYENNIKIHNNLENPIVNINYYNNSYKIKLSRVHNKYNVIIILITILLYIKLIKNDTNQILMLIKLINYILKKIDNDDLIDELLEIDYDFMLDNVNSLLFKKPIYKLENIPQYHKDIITSNITEIDYTNNLENILKEISYLSNKDILIIKQKSYKIIKYTDSEDDLITIYKNNKIRVNKYYLKNIENDLFLIVLLYILNNKQIPSLYTNLLKNVYNISNINFIVNESHIFKKLLLKIL